MSRNSLLLYLHICFVSLVLISEKLQCNGRRLDPNEKECEGTSNRYTYTSQTNRYQQYAAHYTNCTVVRTNLEIVYMHQDDLAENETFDMSFLENIKEVYGYVLIAYNHVDVIPLPNLRVIHGNYLFTSGTAGYSLFVSHNIHHNASGVGLREIRLNSLHEIVRGSVSFIRNDRLCYMNTINWNDILSNRESTVSMEMNNLNMSSCEATCNESCRQNLTGSSHCWGPGEDNCQQFHRLTCSDGCDKHCYGPGPGQCCIPECAGGCLGAKSECWTCRNFIDSGSCVSSCPPAEIYNSRTFRMERNPNVKYAFKNMCVKKCPGNMYVRNGACVTICGDGYMPSETDGRKCVPCFNACPKNCTGGEITSRTIQDYVNCTIIEGSLRLLNHAFIGTKNIAPLNISDLHVLETVKEITECLQIEMSPAELTSLSFLRNLKKILGHKPCSPNDKFTLKIVFTQLKSLGLTSLETVEQGVALIYDNSQLEELGLTALRNVSQKIMIHKNSKLCYYKTVNWTALAGSMTAGNNANQTECELQNKTCSDHCDDGCWGPRDDQCVRCIRSSYRLDRQCLASCADLPGLFEVANGKERLCKRCHVECEGGCTGEDADKCTRCRNAKDGPYCVERCPEFKYRQGKRCVESCDSDHYSDPISRECYPCDYRCTQCHGPTNRDCLTCKYKYFKLYASDIPQGSEDVSSSDAPYRASGGGTMTTEWYEGTSISYNKSLPADPFYCEEKCPDYAPEKIPEIKDKNMEDVCTTKVKAEAVRGYSSPKGNDLIVAIFTIIGIIAAVACTSYFAHRFRSRRIQRMEEKKAELLGMKSLKESSPSNYRPDLSNLRLIKETELIRLEAIGSGAFGTVYRGVWTPSGERLKIPVAIKVLQKGDNVAELNAELLDEARIMAAVRHENCIRNLAVCLTAELMLISQLMPNGSLLEYIRKHRQNIGSNALLTWCRQIASGMMYLEDVGIVHRDLAARNVLVEGPLMVKITDFGLAKLVHDEEGYLATGGKVPIKWLALESIQHRVFTHKSDVWSYGVTLWEIFTYGQKPYENVSAIDMCDLLEKGERLPQPHICTIDVYMIMIKCWMVDAQSRPSFSELVKIFESFGEDPGRYLVIQEEDKIQLPSAEQNLRDMLRGLSILEDDESQVISAEEYLRPHDLLLDHLAMSNTGVDYTNLSDGAGSPLMTPIDCKDISELEASFASKSHKEVNRKPSQRYFSTPTKDQKLTKMNSYTSEGSQADQKPLQQLGKERRALDEDDYLRPLSTAGKHPNYIDLMGGGTPDLEDLDGPEGKDYVNSCPGGEAIMQNPEYFSKTNPRDLLYHNYQ